MKRIRKTILFLTVLLPLTAARADDQVLARSGNPVFDRTVQIVLGNFYAADALDQFRQAVDAAVANLPNLASDEEPVVDDAIAYVLSSLGASHTARYTPDDLDYYELLDVFRYAVRDGLRRLYPQGQVVYPGIGIATRTIGGVPFVTDVYDGGPADRAGILAGDEIVSVDGSPFEEIAAFNDKAGGTAALVIRRAAGAEPTTVAVEVAWLKPSESLVLAIENSARVIERDGFRLGYLRLWAYTERDVKDVVERALAGPLAEADGLILDLRSRWGGAPADAADSFVGGAPDMTMTFRDGRVDLVHARWREPVVAVIDEGTRSGMEILAYALKANGVRMVGTNTAGAVLAGRGYLLPDDSLLILAVADVTVDGNRLEGVGVAPDVAVPFDVRYAADGDPQVEAAIAEMERLLAAGGVN
jgi:C-terminal processing protease CtpA/Prc